MQKIWNLISLFMLLLTTVFVQAQEGTAKTGFGETMRSSGRIYVVIAVILTKKTPKSPKGDLLVHSHRFSERPIVIGSSENDG